ncbi:MAG: hypothetical protein KBD19_03610 [Candidatus Moranbacteria bacterium]|nr:hypothetical protein [Candidatus Moranbacteria bacterium]
MTNIVILIVEDKDEEIIAAEQAVKNHFGIPLDESGAYLGLEVAKEKLGLPDWKAYKVGDGIVSIMTARNLSEANAGLKKVFGDEKSPGFRNAFPSVGILTDLMFPGGRGKGVQANGIDVILMAIEHKVPVVVCSDTDHHEVGFVPRLATTLAPLHPAGKIPVILDKKDWGKAITLLSEIMP